MSSKVRDEKVDYLFKAILTLESVEDCYAFFEDLCTISEIQEMSRRMHAAKLLQANHCADKCGISPFSASLAAA